MPQPCSDDPDHDNALAGVWYALLFEAGVVAMIVLLYWLLHWLF